MAVEKCSELINIFRGLETKVGPRMLLRLIAVEAGKKER